MKWVNRCLIALSIILLFSLTVNAGRLDISIYTLDGTTKDYGNLDAKPGETLHAFIEVENTFTDYSEDAEEFQDIEISGTIETFDDDDSIDFDFDTFDLRAKKKHSIPFDIDVPLQISDGGHTIDFTIEADLNGTEYTETDSYSIDVNKDSHNISIQKLTLSPTELKCGGAGDVGVDLLDLGTDNEDEFSVFAISDKLGIVSGKNASIEAYPDDDTTSVNIPIKISRSQVSGTYPITVQVRYDKYITEKTINLKVNCANPAPSDQDNGQSNEQTNTPTTNNNQQTVDINAGQTTDNGQQMVTQNQQNGLPTGKPELIEAKKDNNTGAKILIYSIIVLFIAAVLLSIYYYRRDRF